MSKHTPGSMPTEQRHEWMYGKGTVQEYYSHVACSGGFACDHCGEPSSMIGHRGRGSTPYVLCADCYLEMLAVERATRPSRAELIANVNAAIAKAEGK